MGFVLGINYGSGDDEIREAQLDPWCCWVKKGKGLHLVWVSSSASHHSLQNTNYYDNEVSLLMVKFIRIILIRCHRTMAKKLEFSDPPSTVRLSSTHLPGVNWGIIHLRKNRTTSEYILIFLLFSISAHEGCGVGVMNNKERWNK